MAGSDTQGLALKMGCGGGGYEGGEKVLGWEVSTYGGAEEEGGGEGE
jgi:hypothetical protein